MSAAVPLRPRHRFALPGAIVALTLFGTLVAFESPHLFLAVGPLLLVVMVLLFTHERLLSWRYLLSYLVLMILFVPIGRYELPGGLPFQLEPYRVLAAVVLLAWATSLLIDRRVRLRSTGFDSPLIAIVLTILASVVVNPTRLGETMSHAVKSLTFFASFIIIALLIVSVIRSFEHILGLMRILVGGMTIVAVSAIIEFRTGGNLYNHLDRYVPFLRVAFIPDEPNRGGVVRAYASAQHPIAAGAVFVLLVPCAVALAYITGKRRWWLSSALLLMGTFATGSRTGVIMLLVALGVLFAFKGADLKRLWPLLLPSLAAIHFAVPGMLGTIKDQFFPKGGLLAQQSHVVAGADIRRTHGRLVVWGPAFNEVGEHPVLGEGFGTRIVDVGVDQNATILDNQWLDTLLETGWLGGLAWVWLFAATFRRMKRIVRYQARAPGWLATGLAASTLSYAVGLVFYDGFSFIQCAFVFFILLGVAGSLNRWALDHPFLEVRETSLGR